MRVSRLFLMVSSLLLLASPALATFPHEEEVPQDSRVFFVDETKLPFTEMPGLPSTRYWGIDHGAGSRIENYLGFPTGISGQLLASNALVQAEKFGAELVYPVEVMEMAAVGDIVTITGTFAKDKDFGAGYLYKAIVEDAKVQK